MCECDLDFHVSAQPKVFVTVYLWLLYFVTLDMQNKCFWTV